MDNIGRSISTKEINKFIKHYDSIVRSLYYSHGITQKYLNFYKKEFYTKASGSIKEGNYTAIYYQIQKKYDITVTVALFKLTVLPTDPQGEFIYGLQIENF